MDVHQGRVQGSQLVGQGQDVRGVLHRSTGYGVWRLPSLLLFWRGGRQVAKLPRGVGRAPALITANTASSIQAGDLAEVDAEARLGVVVMSPLAVESGGVSLLTAVVAAPIPACLFADGGCEDDFYFPNLLCQVCPPCSQRVLLESCIWPRAALFMPVPIGQRVRRELAIAGGVAPDSS